MLRAMLRLVAVFVGGAAGTSARWGIGQAIPVPAEGFPLGTFAANISGSFVLGFLTLAVFDRMPAATYLRLLLGVGLLGGYTTFSTFAVEGIELLTAGAWGTAVLYWVATVIVGQMCGVYGMWLARLPLRAAER